MLFDLLALFRWFEGSFLSREFHKGPATGGEMDALDGDTLPPH